MKIDRALIRLSWSLNFPAIGTSPNWRVPSDDSLANTLILFKFTLLLASTECLNFEDQIYNRLHLHRILIGPLSISWRWRLMLNRRVVFFKKLKAPSRLWWTCEVLALVEYEPTCNNQWFLLETLGRPHSCDGFRRFPRLSATATLDEPAC